VPDEEEVTLWRAPQGDWKDAAREVKEGYVHEHYPAQGPYFATEKAVAVAFQYCYRNGMQEIHLPRLVFEDLVQKGLIQPDGFYLPGQSWHVPSDGLAVFNRAIQLGSPNEYHPEEG
jgi:hypothetical protein